MPSAVTLGDLKTRVLDLADATNSGFIVDGRLGEYINAELSELYDLLVNSFEDYFVTIDQSITLAAGTESYNLPTDFYKALKVFLLSGGQRYRLARFNLEELDYQSPLVDSPAVSNSDLRYRIMGGKIYFHPKPGASGSIDLFYVPEFTNLASDVTTISFSVPVGWEDFVVYGAAARCMIKEESDPGAYLALKGACRDRIINAAQNRDAGEPMRITDKYDRFGVRRYLRGAR